MRRLIRMSLTSLVVVALGGYGAFSFTPPTQPQPAIGGLPIQDFTVHDPQDLVFGNTRLSGEIVTVQGAVACLNDLVCILDLPGGIDDVIGVRLQVPLNLRRNLFHRFQSENCTQLLTGLFTGYDLVVTQFSPGPDCGAYLGPIGSTAFHRVSVGLFSVPRGMNKGTHFVSSPRIFNYGLDAYRYENETRFQPTDDELDAYIYENETRFQPTYGELDHIHTNLENGLGEGTHEGSVSDRAIELDLAKRQ